MTSSCADQFLKQREAGHQFSAWWEGCHQLCNIAWPSQRHRRRLTIFFVQMFFKEFCIHCIISSLCWCCTFEFAHFFLAKISQWRCECQRYPEKKTCLRPQSWSQILFPFRL